ncbi:hypothetical protein [Antarcticimicrobium luteum]|uniref:Uncharacterized protein n=1 Tax=Antarcticimicrobium luteum TaxID=2547397 RepID=A0A4R5VDU7_9RHOB|nr:hypothetical protein [Antarcticimicrobium luteum]TDK50427.1 hypothetical protein E1832_06330 [Antarcticimicrobium luteum]
MNHLKIIERGGRVSAPLALEKGPHAVIAEGTRDGAGLRIGWQLFPLTGLNIIELEGGTTTAELVNTGPDTDAAIYLAKLHPVAGGN